MPSSLARILFLAAAVGAASAAHAALWVSSAGDDHNPGTEEQPLRTIGRARDVVRTLNHDMADDITVFIGGEHHLDRPVRFGPEDSGSNGYNVVYTASPGEHPVISGGFRVSGWTPAEGERSLWSAPAPPGLEYAYGLFVNGTPASRTRSRLVQAFSRSAAGTLVSAPDPKALWKNPGDVVFEPHEPGAIWSERGDPAPAFVENAFELLGRPGEWYFDRPALRIYYTPRPGEDMATADVEAAAAQALVAGSGSGERPITGLIFKGIRFEYAAWPLGARPGGTASFPAAVSLGVSRDVQFVEDEFLHMGTPGIDLGPGVEGTTVDGCVFADISWAALRIVGATRIRVAESRFTFVGTEHDGDAIELDHSTDVSIKANQIDHFPNAGIIARNEPPSAVREDSNLISEPMVRYDGSRPDGGGAPAAQGGAGLPEAYRGLLDVRFRSATIPRPPTQVSAEAEDEFAYVTWMPSCMDGGSPVASYTVASSTGARTTVSSDDFQARGYVVVGGLENGHAVSFTVLATNAEGTGPPSLPSASVSPLTKRRLRVPPPPAIVTVAPSDGGTRVEITPSNLDGGGPVVAFSIDVAPSGQRIVLEGLDVIHCDVTRPLARRIAGLSLDPSSSVTAVATNAAGDSKPAVAKRGAAPPK